MTPSEIEAAAKKQFQNFNKALSSKTEIRFGSKGSVSVALSGEKAGLWYDFESSEGGRIEGIEFNELKPSVPQRRKNVYLPDAEKFHRVEDIVRSCRDPFRTPAEVYLSSRGIYCSLPHSIRFCERPVGMAGLFQNAEGDIVAVQVTYLTRGGEKQNRKIQKQTFSTGANWHRYAAIRIPGKGELILCEGIETALSIHQVTGRPVWACTSTSNLSTIVLKNKRVTIAHDGDEPGSKADQVYTKTIQRLLSNGKRVRLARPPIGKDFNDVLAEDGEGRVLDLIEEAEACQRL